MKWIFHLSIEKNRKYQMKKFTSVSDVENLQEIIKKL